MELALLVYVISLLKPIGIAIGISTFIVGVVALLWWIGWLATRDYRPDDQVSSKMPRRWTIATVLLILVSSVFPSEKTAYLMVGAYATQKIAEAPKTQELGAEVLKIIELKIKHYAAEAEKEMFEKLEKETAKK